MRGRSYRGLFCSSFLTNPSLCPVFEPDPQPTGVLGKNFKSVLTIGLADDPVLDAWSLPEVYIDPNDFSPGKRSQRYLGGHGWRW